MQSRVSIVIVSWNVADKLRDCLHSVQTTTKGADVEVIVVDNASSDETLAMLSGEFPHVGVIANQTNVGFAKACNQGIEVSSGQYVFLLNPDTVLMPGTVATLSRYLDTHPSVGMAGPKFLSPTSETQFACARRFPTLWSEWLLTALALDKVPGLGTWLSRRLLYSYDYDTNTPVDTLSGGALMVRREVIERIGRLDERFFLTYEDTEWCHRAHEAGYDIVYLPEATLIHYHGESRRKSPKSSVLRGVESATRYYQSVHGPVSAVLYKMIIIMFLVPRLFVGGLVRFLLGDLDRVGFAERIDLLWTLLRQQILSNGGTT